MAASEVFNLTDIGNNDLTQTAALAIPISDSLASLTSASDPSSLSTLSLSLSSTPPNLSTLFSEELFNDSCNSALIATDNMEFPEHQLPSIQSDLQKMSSYDTFLEWNYFDESDDVKPELRNGDCMWSVNVYAQQLQQQQQPTKQLNQLSRDQNFGIYDDSTAVPPAMVTGQSPSLMMPMSIRLANNVKREDSDNDYDDEDNECFTAVKNNNNNNNSSNSNRKSNESVISKSEIKSKSFGDYERRQHQSSRLSVITQQELIQPVVGRAFATDNHTQYIAPGTSLLRKSINNSNNNNNNNNSNCSGMLQATKRNALKLRQLQPIILRPDTPHSLEDNFDKQQDMIHELQHNIDLHACVLGSNQYSLLNGGIKSTKSTLASNSGNSSTLKESSHIDHLSRELQNTNKMYVDNPFSNGPMDHTLSDILELINNQQHETRPLQRQQKQHHQYQHHKQFQIQQQKPIDGVSRVRNGYIKSEYIDDDDEDADAGRIERRHLMYDRDDQDEPEYDDDDEEDVDDEDDNTDDDDGDDGDDDYDDDNVSSNGDMNEHAQPVTNGANYPYLHHISDHSYTRYKGIDHLGPNLETPSDSDEEIDVVSVGDKKLPTNPSEKDRRVLQTRVASKFTNARITKACVGVRVLLPKRRGSFDFPYTPASSSPVKSVANSRYPSPATTPYQQYAAGSTVDVTNYNLLISGDKNRKRYVQVQQMDAAKVAGVPPVKKYRGRKTAASAVNSMTASVLSKDSKQKQMAKRGAILTATNKNGNLLIKRLEVSDESDNMDRRHLHNDMERLRRIGLKNLFEALKKQIPSIKDKERAPKVNILREATKFCEQLVAEDRRLQAEQEALLDSLQKKKALLMSWRQQRQERN